MGRVIKAHCLAARLDPLGRQGQGAIEHALETRARSAELTRAARERIIDLALTLAGRIVGEAVTVDPELLDRVYDRALAEIGELVPVTIRVHPGDRAASGIDEAASRQGISVTSDPAVGRAGCRVEAAGVTIDATIEAAREALRVAMTGRRRG